MSLLTARHLPQTTSITLTEVVLDALSNIAYIFASNNPELVEQSLTLSNTHLHLGSIHELTPDHLPNEHESRTILQYRILMLEPTSRGRVDPESTNIIVVHSENSNSLVSSSFLSDNVDSDSIEIDETFLRNSIASSALQFNGSDCSTPSSINGHAPHFFFDAEPLISSVSPPEDHCSLFLRTADLGRVGLLNEDWAIASSCQENGYRLVRVVAFDQLVKHPGTICGSPVLLFNIIGYPEQNDDKKMHQLMLRPSPFGHRQPAIPTAKSVTIAKIASPFSINKKYQVASLDALKSYFSATKRLVKANDVIALSLYTGSGPIIHDSEHGQDECATAVNEIVYFLVTNIEHSVIPSTITDGEQDFYTGSTVGELGCWVDSAVTRIIQTGLEHARVPGLGSYLESDVQHGRSTFSFLKRLSSSRLLCPEAPFSRLRALISAGFSRHSINYGLQLTILLKGVQGIGKFWTVFAVAQSLGMHILEVDCFSLIGENNTKTEGTLRVRFDQACACSPCILVLRNIEALIQSTQPLDTGKDPAIVNALRECIAESAQSWRMGGFPIGVVATSNNTSQIPASILSSFKHQLEFEAPNEEERLEILQALLWNSTLAADISLKDLARQTAALIAIDLSDLVFRAKLSALERAGEMGINHILISAQDFNSALKKARAAYSENIGVPKIPNVTWDDVGGLVHVKADILDTIQLPLEHPELFTDGVKKRSGILLYGPPGTGKTLVAKAVATSCALNFFSVKGPELLNMYIGESEANVRHVFQRARDAKPCVIFFDELDSVAPKRGNHGDSGGVMDRIVSQLLAEIDGMSSSNDVFVIGATNRPDLLDPALLRPGRFDRMLYLGVSETHEVQLKIIEALTRKFRLHSDLDLRSIANACPFNYTGADFYALCSDAMLNAMSRTAQQVEDQLAKLNQDPMAEIAHPAEIQVEVTQEDFSQALENLVPSVSQAEMEHYAQVQKQFSQDASNDKSASIE